MKVLNLRCAHEHGFEGWFGSEEDFQSQFDRGLVECPLCADKTITRLPTAPRLNVSRSREVAPVNPFASEELPASATPEAHTLQALWQRAVQHVLASTDDVGERFVEEARRMHYGETEERAIRGSASRADAEALQEEGIEVMTLPLPAAAKSTLQ
ncbi:MAG: hypothetical protein RLZZ618_731 [Pseudomonadota bacterium]|jgi:hypothetical protein